LISDVYCLLYTDRKKLEQELQEEESSDDDIDGLNLAGDDGLLLYLFDVIR